MNDREKELKKTQIKSELNKLTQENKTREKELHILSDWLEVFFSHFDV